MFTTDLLGKGALAQCWKAATTGKLPSKAASSRLSVTVRFS